MAHLLAHSGPISGHTFHLVGSCIVLGRDQKSCQVHLDVGAVSRQHAQITGDGRDFWIEDLNSRNKTYVNDQPVSRRQRLVDGDRLRICDVVFSFHGDAPVLSPSGRSPAPQQPTVLLQDDESTLSGSSIMGKLDVASTGLGVQLNASPEVKLRALIEITQSFRKALALDDVLPQVLNSLFKIFVQADRGFIVMKQDDGQLVAMWTKVRREENQDTLRISRTIIRQAMDAREAILSSDATSDSRFDMSQSIANVRIRSLMCAPLLDSEGNAIGALQIDTLDQRKRFQQDDLEVLVSVAIQAGIAVDNAKMHERALNQRELERDLQLATEVQRAFLPQKAPELAGYEFFNFYRSAQHIGGDYFDYIMLSDGRLAVVVADVVGHGVAAAMLMAKLSAEARFCLASESLPAVAINQLNDRMSRLGIDRFVTLIMAVIDPARHEVTVVNAGHMAPLLRRRDGSVEEPGEEHAGLPLGITDGMVYEARTAPLHSGDVLMLFTDGINEAMNEHGECYGIDRIRQHLSHSGAVGPAVGQSLVDDVLHFVGDGAQDDDMCLVCLQRQ